MPNVAAWDATTVSFEDKTFVRDHTRSIFHMPVNMASVMRRLSETATSAGARVADDQMMILSRDLSSWRAEHLYAVSAPVSGADNVALSGTFATLVFDGPFKNVPRWQRAMAHYVAELGAISENVYFFYTTCPTCSKHYGHNYVIGFARIH